MNKDPSVEIIEMQYIPKNHRQDREQPQDVDEEGESQDFVSGRVIDVITRDIPKSRNAEAFIEYKKEIKSMSYSDRFKAFFSNAAYNIKGFTKSAQKKVKINQKHKVAWLFSRNYVFNPQKPEEAMNTFLKHHEQIIWFSYRNNFPIIRNVFDESQSASNDYGWGCMIRCSQMLLATTLKRHFMKDFSFSFEKSSQSQQQGFFKQIIRLFLDCTSSDSEQVNPNEMFSMFGIQSICNKALLHRYQKNVKNWYTSIQVSFIFQEILEESQKIGSKTPLKVINFTDQIIFIKELEQAANIANHTNGITQHDSNLKQSSQSSCLKDNSIENTLKEEQKKQENDKRSIPLQVKHTSLDDSGKASERQLLRNYSSKDLLADQHKDKNSEELLQIMSQGKIGNEKEQKKNCDQVTYCNLLVMVHMKFGIQKFEQQHKKYFFDLISLPSFIGALSGTDTKGMYIVGHQDNRVIVLDPHYVQEATVGLQGLEKDYSTYFNKIPRCFEVDQLSSDISIGYYVNVSEKNGINDFIDSIYDLNQRYSDPMLCVLIDRVEVNETAEEQDYFQQNVSHHNANEDQLKNKELKMIKEESQEYYCPEQQPNKLQMIQSFFVSNGLCLNENNSQENKKSLGTASDYEVIS